MTRKTIATALAAATIAGSALFATTASSQAGYYYGGGYGGGHYGGGYGYYQSYCFVKKIKVHGYYGWHWKRIRVCH